MSGQVTPNKLVLDLLDLGRDLDQITESLAGIEHAAVRTREAYVVAKEQALLGAPQEFKYQYEREAHSKIATSVQRIAAELADAEVRIVRAKIACIKSRIDVGRSASAALREEMRLA